MKKARASLFICVIFFLGLFQAAFGQDNSHPSKNVDHILMKMQQANSLIKYRGIMTTILINNPFSEVCRYQIENYGNMLRKEELLTNGAEKEIDYDDGKNLWRFFPNKNFLLKENTKINNPLHNKTKELIELAKKNYEIKISGEHEINQRTCSKVIFKPKNNDRPQQIFWIDSETGIPFKIEKYGPDDELVSVSSFSSIEFQVAATKENLDFLVPSQTDVAEVKEKFNLTLADAQTQIGGEISSPAYIPAGFNLTNIILRSLGPEKTIQFFYTDGLSSFSIFHRSHPRITATVKTPYGEMVVKGKAALMTSSGTMNILTIHSNQTTTTVMGELFKESIVKVADSLNTDHKPLQKQPSSPVRAVNGAPSK